MILLTQPRNYVFTRVCLFVCLSVNRVSFKTIEQIFAKFYEMVGHNPGNNMLDSE